MVRKLSDFAAAEVARLLAELPFEFDENAPDAAPDFAPPVDAASAAEADAILKRFENNP